MTLNLEEHEKWEAEKEAVEKRKEEDNWQAKVDSEAAARRLPRLLTIKGRDRARPCVVPSVCECVSKRDYMILETKYDLYVWKGEFAPITQKRRAYVDLVANELVAERCNASDIKVHHYVKYEDKGSSFWSHLRGDRCEVSMKGKGDHLWQTEYEEATRFYRFDVDMGLMPEKELSRRTLDKREIYVLSCPYELYVWYGRLTGLLKRKKAKVLAVEQLQDTGRWASYCKVKELVQGEEDFVFRAKFPDWQDGGEADRPLTAEEKLEVYSEKMLKFNPAASLRIPDVDGTLNVWVAKDHGKVPMARAAYGEFFSGSSYILLYQSEVGKVIYFWQGSMSATDWKHCSPQIQAVQKMALESFDFIKRKTAKVPVMRVLEGEEPPHFMGLFGGGMVIRDGKLDSFDQELLIMFQVRGHDPFDTRAVQCGLSKRSLNTEDAFLVYSPRFQFVWRGAKCSEWQHKVAERLSNRYHAMETRNVLEGEEPEEFWALLGGKVALKDLSGPRNKARRCPKCGKANPSDFKFCRKCGESLAVRRTRRVREDKGRGREERGRTRGSRCTKCNKGVRSGQSICKGCARGDQDADVNAVMGDDMVGDMIKANKRPRKKKTPRRRKAGGTRCPSCQARNGEGVSFCKKCGTPLSDDVVVPAVVAQPVIADDGPKQCPSAACGKVNPAGMRFCRMCGTSMVTQVKEEQAAQVPPPDEKQEEEEDKPCPSCSTPNPPDGKWCFKCGSEMAAPSKECSSCSTPNPPDGKWCFKCGTQFQ